MLRVSEVFRSVQAEGEHTGSPAAFVRLYGCGVQCPWCDTSYAWKPPAQTIAFEELVEAPPESPFYADVAEEDLAAWVNGHPSRHVVITGGEPFEQRLLPLLQHLVPGSYVQVETSGTIMPGLETLCRVDWLTVSPKVGMPGGLVVSSEMLGLAHEIKMPVGREQDLAVLDGLLMGARPDVLVWLQPLSLSPKATQLCIEAAAARGWRVSLQGHKLAGLR